MKRKLGSAIALAAIGAAGAVAPGAVSAQSAYQTTFQTSITYQNVGTTTATVSFDFYAEGSAAPINVARTLAPNAAGSLFIGGLNELANFKGGSVVVSSNERIVATSVQIPASTSPTKNRLLYNSFDKGATKQLIATVLKNRFNFSTKFSVQNSSTVAANGTVRFFNADAGGAEIVAARQTISNLAPGSAKFYDANAIAALPSPFNGSATIELTSGEAVAAAMELQTNGPGASAFEGIEAGGTTVYMPSALCNAFPTAAGSFNSFYAVQNTSTSATANVRVTYSNGKFQDKSIGPGAKQSFAACDAAVGNNFNGSATITSNQPIVALAKIQGKGVTTSALGATSGAAKLALPYVRYTTAQYASGARQRAFIAVQNVGSDLAAGTVRVAFIDVNGNTVGTYTYPNALPKGAKFSTNASVIGAPGAEFGYANNAFGGSAVITGPSGSQLTAVVRVQSQVGATEVGEDYNGIAVQ